MRRLIIIVVILVIFISGCNRSVDSDNMGHENVELKTEDDIKIVGDFYKGGEKGIILLHMLSVTKKSMEEFALQLQEKGYSVIAIDLRGHGQSDLNWEDFGDKEFNDMVNDVDAAKKFLDKEKNAVIGASIGANLALKYANNVDAVVSLSPSFNYKGLETKEDSSKINKPVLIVSSEEDTQSSKDSRELGDMIQGSVTKIYNGKGHGTRMLDKEVTEFVLNWLGENF